MIRLIFIGTCVGHNTRRKITLEGKDTPRQVDKGYNLLAAAMIKDGCTDYERTHSVSRNHKRHEVYHR